MHMIGNDPCVHNESGGRGRVGGWPPMSGLVIGVIAVCLPLCILNVGPVAVRSRSRLNYFNINTYIFKFSELNLWAFGCDTIKYPKL